MAVVRAKRAYRQLCESVRCAAPEEQQDAPAADIVGAKSVVALRPREAKDVFVKAGRTIEIILIERSF
jgi:hypothetical protein